MIRYLLCLTALLFLVGCGKEIHIFTMQDEETKTCYQMMLINGSISGTLGAGMTYVPCEKVEPYIGTRITFRDGKRIVEPIND